jgi:regulatory protein RepA
MECRQLDLLEAFSRQPKPLDFILPGMLAQSVGSIVSPGGLGKSYFALELAIQIAGGPDLLGLGKLKNGKVLYLPAEDPLEAISHRLYALSPIIAEDQLII